MSCEEKKRFNSKQAAIQHLRKVQGKRVNHIDQHPYLCPDCHYWHFTTNMNGGYNLEDHQR